MPAFSSCRVALEYLDVPYLRVLALMYQPELRVEAHHHLQKVAARRHDVEKCNTLLAYMLVEI